MRSCGGEKVGTDTTFWTAYRLTDVQFSTVAVTDDSADGCGQPRPRLPSAVSPAIVHFLLVRTCVLSRGELRSEPGPPRRINPVDARPRGASERQVHAASTGPTRAGSLDIPPVSEPGRVGPVIVQLSIALVPATVPRLDPPQANRLATVHDRFRSLTCAIHRAGSWPHARHHLTNSIGSIRRSPVSVLWTKVWGRLSLRPSSRCVSPASNRHCRSS